MKRNVPKMTTDEEADAFLEQDLSNLNFSQFKPVRFEFQAKAARLNMRLPAALRDAVKCKAKARGVPMRGSSARCWNTRRLDRTSPSPSSFPRVDLLCSTV